jgi:hypothetical protein
VLFDFWRIPCDSLVTVVVENAGWEPVPSALEQGNVKKITGFEVRIHHHLSPPTVLGSTIKGNLKPVTFVLPQRKLFSLAFLTNFCNIQQQKRLCSFCRSLIL